MPMIRNGVELGCTSGTTLEMQNIGMIRKKKKAQLHQQKLQNVFYCEFFGIKIVKFFGKYYNTPKTSLFDSDDTNQKITNQVKVIYCLKESEINIIKGDIEVVSIEEVQRCH